MPKSEIARRTDTDSLRRRLAAVREHSLALAEPLSEADATAQSMPDASPAKWHLAHTSWFFERVVLQAHAPGYRPYNEAWHQLFNSYYESLGARHPRAQRGLLTRPSLAEVKAYRRHVDEALERLLEAGAPDQAPGLVELGCQHEQQHQELLLTDILHLFSLNPLRPAYRAAAARGQPGVAAGALEFIRVDGGLKPIGSTAAGFAFDCEGPRHEVMVPAFRLANRPVTNREWIEFIEDGAYRQPLLWLSEGWDVRERAGWTLPLYWEAHDGEYRQMTLAGLQRVDPEAPVSHVSYFEAEAFARWAGARLPTEFEWETVAAGYPVQGNFGDSRRLQPCASDQPGMRQLFGDVWEWTASPFTPYPRFRAAEGAVGEYNGKFMSGQYVLRGGSCATPAGHLRASYRNFFAPAARWQFSGLRLAQDD